MEGEGQVPHRPQGCRVITGEQLRDEAMSRVDRAAPADWKELARQAVERVASERDVFTTDHVWLDGLEKPPEPRAMGPIMRRAIRAGLIEKTGRVVPTIFPEGHAGPRHEWRSLIRTP